MILRKSVRFYLVVAAGCLLPHWAWAQSAIPFKHENAAGGSDVSRVVLALLLCVLVLGVALFVLRKYLPGVTRVSAGGRRLQILETQRLGPRTALHVVQFGEREYLIGDSEQGLVNLASVQSGAGAPTDSRREAVAEPEAKIETKMESPDAQP